MRYFKPQPSAMAEWWVLVTEAQLATGYQFEEDIENYLVLTLDRFITCDDLASSALAIDFLASFEHPKKQAQSQLRDVGDQCLLLSGLFPERALKKNVSLDYFVSLGQQAYGSIAAISHPATFDAELFDNLSQHFVGLMDVLYVMRGN